MAHRSHRTFVHTVVVLNNYFLRADNNTLSWNNIMARPSQTFQIGEWLSDIVGLLKVKVSNRTGHAGFCREASFSTSRVSHYSCMHISPHRHWIDISFISLYTIVDLRLFKHHTLQCLWHKYRTNNVAPAYLMMATLNFDKSFPSDVLAR